MNTISRNLLLSEIFRIVFVLLVLYGTKIPVFYKIVLVILSDSFDCRVPKWIFHDWVDPNSNLYQVSDKITDTISYGIQLYYIVSIDYLSKIQQNIVLFLYTFRLIGVFFFLLFLERIILIYFPNFFLEVLFVFVMVKHFEIPEKYIPYLLFLVGVWKFLQEYYLHIYKEEHPNSFLR